VNTAEGNVDGIVRERFFPGNKSGVCVDVGAARPDSLSVSASFRAIGWKIIAIEPNPEFCQFYKDKGWEVLQYACGEHDADDVDFFVVDSHGARYRNVNVSYESFSSLGIKPSYSALKPDLDTKKIKVKVRRLDSILENHAPDVDRIDILTIDVEGWELEVLRGLDIERYRPKVMIIENLFNGLNYRKFMKNFNYVLWNRLPPNDVYVSAELIPDASSRFFLSIYDLLVLRRGKYPNGFIERLRRRGGAVIDRWKVMMLGRRTS
jgi:FkbM family methyltransferase